MFLYEHDRSATGEYIYHQFDTDLNYHLHLHRSFEFIYVEEGLLEVQINDRIHPIPAGHAALILPEQLHAYHTPEHAYSYLCIFSCDYLYDLTAKVRGKRAEAPVFLLEDTACISLLSAPHLNRFQLKSALYSVAGQFLANCPLTDAPKDSTDLLEQTIMYVQEHFREPISLRTAAAALGYHYNYLSAFLNHSLGMHFTELVNNYRVDYACELLEREAFSVTDIAAGCGFETIRSFNRNFRRLRGQTPMEYRKTRSLESIEA